MNKQFILGVIVKVTSYVPNQNNRNLYIESKSVKIPCIGSPDCSNFDFLNLTVSSEFSYNVSMAYYTKFGNLKESKNVTLVGSLEELMKSVGCYIRYDYSLEGVKLDNNPPIFVSFNAPSVVCCAEECLRNDSCVKGWSYQIATKRCLMFKTANVTMVQPGSILNSLFNNLGWVSGLKSCEADKTSVRQSCGCPDGWQSFYGSKFCYFYEDEKATFIEAKSSCENKKATLASIHNETINNFIASNLTGGHEAFIGAYRIGNNVTDFAWLDSSTWKYNKLNQTNDIDCKTNEYCTIINYHSSGVWNDVSCFESYPYVCQRKIY